MVCCMLSVMVSAYIITLPFTFRAARPAVCVRLRRLRRKPSLSASSIATRETSGKSRPSRSRFTPTNTSYTPCRRSSSIFTLSSVATSLWMYAVLILWFSRYSDSSSAIRLVRVVMSTLSSRSIRVLISSIRSSIWFSLGLTSISGSSSPVGRIVCSTTTPSASCNSKSAGVADT